MRLSELTKGIEILGISGNPDGDIRSVCYDSRQCKADALFVAVPGFRTDGHEFINDALARGARFILHERDYLPPSGITAVRVRDSRHALGRLGKNFYRHPSARLCLIAVVGTNGKTTVTYLLEAILQAAGRSVGVLGTVNYRYDGRLFPAPNTTPESFEMQRILREMADHGVTHVVAEVSSHAIDLRRVDDCAFDLGVFTNLTQDHLDYHQTMENYFQAKKRFFTELLPAGRKNRPQQMVLNGDDPWGRRISLEAPGGRFIYGLDSPCDITVESARFSLEGIEAKLRLVDETFNISSPLLGRFNLYNILAAAAAARAVATPKEAIRDGITALSRIPGRLEKVSTAGQPAVFIDYAHTDDALRRVLENLSAFRAGKIITVFGCGGDRDRGKRPLMGQAATAGSDITVVTSDNPRTEKPLEIIREIEKGIRASKFIDMADLKHHAGQRGYVVLSDRKEAIIQAIGIAESTDIVLIAGKGHEDYQIIGTRKFPFDDRVVAREALQSKWNGRNGS